MYRILFVDDEALIREGISENIRWQELGYELAGVCENGREAREFLQRQDVDVVLTDICMPFVDGIALSKYIHEKHADTKVLILSGYDEFEYAQSAIKYGIEEYLLKPITSFELGAVLTKLKGRLDEERDSRRRQEEVYTAYRRGRMLLRSDALLHTIIGTKTEKECEKERRAAGIEIAQSHYMVGIAQLSIYSGSRTLNEKCRKESALMSFIVYNLCQEIVKEHSVGEVCQGKDNRVFLLFAADNPIREEDKIRTVCRAIIEQVNRSMGLGISIALGSWVESLGSAYKSYEKAEDALLGQFTAGDNVVMDERGRVSAQAVSGELYRIQKNCIRHMKEYNASGLSEDFAQLEEGLRKSGYRREQAIEEMLAAKQGMDGLLRAFKQDELSSKETEGKIKQSANLKEALEILHAHARRQMECLERETGGNKASCAYKAYEYIEQHYSESGLSLQEICTHLGVSTTRFSSAFKQTFGATFMDVLIGLRMKKARELLASTELKNYEIAEKVGFSDPHYFSIAFKKMTGKTPTEYAREWRSE